jgi:preprotein translocase subunit YajC
MNIPFLIIFGILITGLIVFLVYRNQKDEKNFEKQMNNDFPKSKDEEGDAEIDEVMK